MHSEEKPTVRYFTSQYIESGATQGSEEDFYHTGIKPGAPVVVIAAAVFAEMQKSILYYNPAIDPANRAERSGVVSTPTCADAWCGEHQPVPMPTEIRCRHCDVLKGSPSANTTHACCFTVRPSHRTPSSAAPDLPPEPKS